MMQENISEQFIHKLTVLQQTPFPASVSNKARDCFIDYLAVTIGGFKRNEEKNRKFITDNQLYGKSHVIGMNATTDLRTAVMINAFNAHVLELDDSHRVAMTHLGAPIFSALLGVAEQRQCNVKQLLHAAVIGYETAIRLANAVQPGHKKRGFHVSGTCCTVGCAMAVADLLSYEKEEIENTFSAAVTSAAGLLGVISGKSEQKPYNVSNAAVAGVNAALYGKFFTGAENIIGDSRGFFSAMTDKAYPGKLFVDGYVMEGIYQKLYASCRHCHAPMEAMLNIRNISSVELIEFIEVRIYDLAIIGHDHTEIEGISSAKQSIAYGVAVACMYGQCSEEAFTEERVSDEQLLSLVKKVHITEDPELSALVPMKRAAIVTVYLSNGESYSSRVDYPKGEPENPITRQELKDKFYSLAENAGIKKAQCENILDYVITSETEPIERLFDLLSGL